MGRMNNPIRSSILCYRRLPLLVRAALIISVLAILKILRLHYTYRQAIWAKYSPTDFADASFDFETTEEQLETRQELLEARSQWKRLGGGYEGTTYAWNGHAIKRFHPTRQRPTTRNCIPPNLAEAVLSVDERRANMKWPAEILASLLLAGRGDASRTGLGDFIPVTDFFYAATPDSQIRDWYLVSPLAAGGTLLNVVDRLRKDDDQQDYRQVDEHFRSSFHRLLETLQGMHNRGLCHDDVKPDNIFVGDSDEQWLLGDLGNVRHRGNPYHSSAIWQDHGQLPDCRANDAFRAVKVYLVFLRRAVRNSQQFDEALFEGKEPWARLYWMAENAGPHLSVAMMLQWSRMDEPADAPEHYVSKYGRAPAGLRNPFVRMLLSREEVVRRTADKALGFGLSEIWGRIFALSDILGAPVDQCPANG